MRRLVLIRHSTPEIRRDAPAAEWRLSADGVARARQFARCLNPAGATHLFTSFEPKALDTAHALAEAWGLTLEEVPGLHEHERPQAQMLSRDAFEQKVRELFARPAELVFGVETADQARRRFTAAIMRLISRTSGDVVIVTHGTVMTLFVAEATGIEPFAFWKRQQMPCAVSLTIPELRLDGTVFLSG